MKDSEKNERTGSQSSSATCDSRGKNLVSSSAKFSSLFHFSSSHTLSTPSPLHPLAAVTARARARERERERETERNDAPPAAPLLAAPPRRGRPQAPAALEGTPAPESARRARGRGCGAALAREREAGLFSCSSSSSLGLLRSPFFFACGCLSRRAPPVEPSPSELRRGRRGVFPQGLRVANLTTRKGWEGEQQRQLRRQRERLLSFYPLPGVLPRGDKELDSLDARGLHHSWRPKGPRRRRRAGAEEGEEQEEEANKDESGDGGRNRALPIPALFDLPVLRRARLHLSRWSLALRKRAMALRHRRGGRKRKRRGCGGKDLEEPAPGAAARLGPGRRLCVGGCC